ncbi:MAG: hypothetical protein HC883_00450 [Bdellovibrionaceae bacterium]|nr:hypothetical protein [Pseudobdellovibrionaceae bacterium]
MGLIDQLRLAADNEASRPAPGVVRAEEILECMPGHVCPDCGVKFDRDCLCHCDFGPEAS